MLLFVYLFVLFCFELTFSSHHELQVLWVSYSQVRAPPGTGSPTFLSSAAGPHSVTPGLSFEPYLPINPAKPSLLFVTPNSIHTFRSINSFLQFIWLVFFSSFVKFLKYPWTSSWFCIVSIIRWRWFVNLRDNFSFPWHTLFYMPRSIAMQFEDVACFEFGLLLISCLNSGEYGQSDGPTLYHSLQSLTWWWKTRWLLVVCLSLFPSMIASGVKRIFGPFRCGLGTCCTQRFWLSSLRPLTHKHWRQFTPEVGMN